MAANKTQRDFLQWESDQGIGIDVSSADDPTAVVSAYPPEKPIAWLRVSGKQLSNELINELKLRQRIEVVDFGPWLPSEDQLQLLMRNVFVERFYVTNEYLDMFMQILVKCEGRTTDIAEAIP